MLYSSIASLALSIGAAAQVTYENSSGTRLRVDNGTYGPEIEEVHYCEFFPRANTTLSSQHMLVLTHRTRLRPMAHRNSSSLRRPPLRLIHPWLIPLYPRRDSQPNRRRTLPIP
jgi:hypothetical protein